MANKKNQKKSKNKRKSRIGYLTKEGCRNLVARRTMSITSIFVLFSCLVLVGVAFMGVINIENFIGKVQDQNVIMVFADENISDENLQKLKDNINGIKNVKNTVFISKEEGYDALKKEMYDSSIVFESLEGNPLPDAYEVHLEDQKDFSKTVKELSKIPNVQYVRENRQIASQLLSIKRVITYGSLFMISLLLIVSLIIIENTIRLTIENRRLEISIMKSVGATNWFIRWPFMVEGMLLGVISAVLAIFVTWGIYFVAGKAVSKLISNLTIGGVVPFTKWMIPLFAMFMIFGVAAGAIGSAISTARYLKEKEFSSNEE